MYRLVLVVALAGLLAACETPPEPFAYHSGNEIPEGPGVLSGEDGEFVILRK